MNLVQPHRRNPRRCRVPPKRFENKIVSGTIKHTDDKHNSEVKKPKKIDTVSVKQKYYTDKGDIEEEFYYGSRLNKK